MRNAGTLEISAVCRQFKDAINQSAGHDGFKSFIDRLKSQEFSESVFSMVRILPRLAMSDIEIIKPVQEASSGKSSELREREERCEFDAPKQDKMCSKFINRLLIDESIFEEIPGSVVFSKDSNRDYPELANMPRNTLIISRLPNDFTFARFEQFYDALEFIPKMNDVRFCFFKGSYSIILQFARESDASKFFSCCDRRLSNFTKTFGKKYEVAFLKRKESQNVGAEQKRNVQCTKQFIGRMMHMQPQQDLWYYGEDFVAVVVRNTFEQFNAKVVVEKLQAMKIEASVLAEISFRDQSFCLLKLANIDDAERACLYLHRRPVWNSVLKCTIHPGSNYSKRSTENPRLPKMFRSESLDHKRISELLGDMENEEKKRKMSFSDSEGHRGRDGRRDHKRNDRWESSRRKMSRESDSDSSSDSERSPRRLRDNHKPSDYHNDYRDRDYRRNNSNYHSRNRDWDHHRRPEYDYPRNSDRRFNQSESNLNRYDRGQRHDYDRNRPSYRPNQHSDGQNGHQSHSRYHNRDESRESHYRQSRDRK